MVSRNGWDEPQLFQYGEADPAGAGGRYAKWSELLSGRRSSCPQCAPFQPGSHAHAPFTHTPESWQSSSEAQSGGTRMPSTRAPESKATTSELVDIIPLCVETRRMSFLHLCYVFYWYEYEYLVELSTCSSVAGELLRETWGCCRLIGRTH